MLFGRDRSARRTRHWPLATGPLIHRVAGWPLGHHWHAHGHSAGAHSWPAGSRQAQASSSCVSLDWPRPLIHDPLTWHAGAVLANTPYRGNTIRHGGVSPGRRDAPISLAARSTDTDIDTTGIARAYARQRTGVPLQPLLAPAFFSLDSVLCRGAMEPWTCVCGDTHVPSSRAPAGSFRSATDLQQWRVPSGQWPVGAANSGSLSNRTPLAVGPGSTPARRRSPRPGMASDPLIR